MSTSDIENTVTILVTGGSGLVGHGIKDILEPLSNEKWVFVSSREADLLDESAVRELFLKVAPTHVIHLAANVGGLFKNMADNLNMFLENMKMNNNVLKACFDFQIQKCVSCLSTCIFPDDAPCPIDESMLHMGPPHESNFGYAYAKRNIDILNRCYNQVANITTLFTSVIPCNVFGPHDNYNINTGHVIPSLIHKACLAKESNSPLVVFGSGRPLRQFIFSQDLGRLLIRVIREYESPEPIILSVGEQDEISIRGAAEEIVAVLNQCISGSPIEIKMDTQLSDGQYKKTVSNKKMLKYWPDFKFTPFKEALKHSVNWFVENRSTCRAM